MDSDLYESEENEKSQASSDFIKAEIPGHIFKVDYAPFFDAFLRNGGQQPTDEDITACLAHLAGHPDPQCQFANAKFQGLDLQEKSENEIYIPLMKLCTAISGFVRSQQGDAIDEAWPRATPPTVRLPASEPNDNIDAATDSPPSQSQGVLHRHWVLCPNNYTLPVSGDANPAQPKIDMALIIGESDRASTHHRSVGKQPQFYWKDVMLGIEGKIGSLLDNNIAIQVAGYARQLRIEQQDRNFSYLLTISNIECRVWRWDPAACYVSEAINIHAQAREFVRLIWTFSTMTPEEFGFDLNFSNAGRVLASEAKDMQTTLKMTPISVEGQTREEELYLLDKRLFSWPGLFNRNTIVWKTIQLDDNGNPSQIGVIKQNWQDVTRPNEAEFYDKINEITDKVAHLTGWQELDYTEDYRSGVPEDSIRPFISQAAVPMIGGSASRSQSGALPADQLGPNPPVHRKLQRMAFKDFGKSIMEAKDAKELMMVMLDVVQAMKLLDEEGILHRDISVNNMLIDADPDLSKDRTRAGFLIDFGLALRARAAASAEGAPVTAHNHRTGTLPFMAVDLLDSSARDLLHEAHHDLESLFWTLFYVCLKDTVSTSPPLSLTSMPHVAWAHERIGELESLRVRRVGRYKKAMLYDGIKHTFSGKYRGLTQTVSEFSEMCHLGSDSSANRPGFQRLTFGAVESLFQRCLATIDDVSLPDDHPPPPSPTGSTKRRLPTDESDRTGDISGEGSTKRSRK